MDKKREPARIWYGLEERLALFYYIQGSRLGALVIRTKKLEALLKICIAHGASKGADVSIGHPIVLGEISNFDTLITDLVSRHSLLTNPAREFKTGLSKHGIAYLTGSMVDQLKLIGTPKWLFRNYKINVDSLGDSCMVYFTAGSSKSLQPCRTMSFNAKALLEASYQYSRRVCDEEAKTGNRIP